MTIEEAWEEHRVAGVVYALTNIRAVASDDLAGVAEEAGRNLEERARDLTLAAFRVGVKAGVYDSGAIAYGGKLGETERQQARIAALGT